VTKDFITACALVVVAVRVLEVDTASGNHCDFFWYGRDRKVVGSDRSVWKVAVVFCTIDAWRDEVLFLGGIGGVFMLTEESLCQQVFFSSCMFKEQVEFSHVSLPSGQLLRCLSWSEETE